MRPNKSATLTALAMAALLAACGGGDEVVPRESVSQAAPPTKKALAAIVVDAKATLDWAQYKFPTLFPKGTEQSFQYPYQGVMLSVRGYPTTGNYLGIAPNGDIYGLGPFTAGNITSFGNISNYAAQIQADACLTYPGTCDNPPPTGPLNECADPNWSNLPTGLRVRLDYEVTGPEFTGSTVSDTVVDGPDNFEGQSVVKVTSNVTITAASQGFNLVTTGKNQSYHQSAGNGFVRELGDISETESNLPIPGAPGKTITKTVNTPPVVNAEFGLRVGESITLTETYTSTTIQPQGRPPSNGSFTTTYTFEARETLTVFGRSYQTCRYRQVQPGETDVNFTWYLVGRGIPVQIEERPAMGASTFSRLRSGTYNGAPI